MPLPHAKILTTMITKLWSNQAFKIRRECADEGVIAESLDSTQEAFPQLMLGSYPKVTGEEYDVKLTLECRDSSYLEKAFHFLHERLPEGCVLRIE